MKKVFIFFKRRGYEPIPVYAGGLNKADEAISRFLEYPQTESDIGYFECYEVGDDGDISNNPFATITVEEIELSRC
jgi:hypothetical protein